MEFLLRIVYEHVLLGANLKTLAFRVLLSDDCCVYHHDVLLWLLELSLHLLLLWSLRPLAWLYLLCILIKQIALVDSVLGKILEPLHEHDFDLQNCT